MKTVTAVNSVPLIHEILKDFLTPYLHVHTELGKLDPQPLVALFDECLQAHPLFSKLHAGHPSGPQGNRTIQADSLPRIAKNGYIARDWSTLWHRPLK